MKTQPSLFVLTLIGVPLDAFGKGFLPLPLTGVSGLSGVTVHAQAWMLDPSFTTSLGFLLTTSLILTIG